MATTIYGQLYRFEALAGRPIIVPTQQRHADEAAPRFAFFPEAFDTLA